MDMSKTTRVMDGIRVDVMVGLTTYGTELGSTSSPPTMRFTLAEAALTTTDVRARNMQHLSVGKCMFSVLLNAALYQR